MKYLASLEIDQRQRIIRSADKLREMLGGSWTIADTVEEACSALLSHPGLRLVLPVSGVLWFVSDTGGLRELGPLLWRLRETFLVRAGLPCTFAIVPYGEGAFAAAVEALENEIRRRKDAKTGEEAGPVLPQFAPCSIQPLEFANQWHPELRSHPQHRRRALISDDSDHREERAHRTLPGKLSRFDTYSRLRRNGDDWTPYEFEHLAVPGGHDSYLALIKADGDGMGRLLLQLKSKWDHLAASFRTDAPKLTPEQQSEFEALYGPLAGPQASWPPESAMCLFSWSLNYCLTKSLSEAVDAAVGQAIQNQVQLPHFPAAPIVAAGEDFWLLCRRDLAFEIALGFGKRYAERAAQHPVLQRALQVAGLAGQEALTLSFGILFARAGFPFEMQVDLAEELLKNAKRRRRETNSREGWLDYHWLESTGRESVKEARRRGLTYTDNGIAYQLFTRPWSLTESKVRWNLACDSGKDLPSRKWHQLDMVLRQGDTLSGLAFRDWRRHLTPDQRTLVDSLRPSSGAPWRETEGGKRTSGLRELFEMFETQAGREPEAPPQ